MNSDRAQARQTSLSGSNMRCCLSAADTVTETENARQGQKGQTGLTRQRFCLRQRVWCLADHGCFSHHMLGSLYVCHELSRNVLKIESMKTCVIKRCRNELKAGSRWGQRDNELRAGSRWGQRDMLMSTKIMRKGHIAMNGDKDKGEKGEYS